MPELERVENKEVNSSLNPCMVEFNSTCSATGSKEIGDKVTSFTEDLGNEVVSIQGINGHYDIIQIGLKLASLIRVTARLIRYASLLQKLATRVPQ